MKTLTMKIPMMRTYSLAIAAVLGCCCLSQTSDALQELPVAADADHAAVQETRAERDARMDWWRRAKFGMFIHYGLYSGLEGEFRGRLGGAEWLQTNLGLDSETYVAEAQRRFCPAEGCTEAWAELAQRAGCRYAVFTTKHHEGFPLFRTAQTDFSAPALFNRDLVQEYVESFRKRGIRIGFYHSVIDWHHPAYDNTICPTLCYPANQAALLAARRIPRDHASYQKYLHAQVRELLTQYGKVDIMWWDYSQGNASGERGWRAPALMDMTRELQPGIIMNNRLYAYSGFDPALDKTELDLRCGDYTSPEKRIPAAGYPGADWEACMTVGDKWGYNRFDVNLKSPATIIRRLQECAARGGNLLLNIGPKGDGSVPAAVAETFTRIGQWMDVNGEAIYGSRPLPSVHVPEGWMVCMAEEDVYIFPPVEKPEGEVVLRILARELNAIAPSILGQDNCKVEMRRVEVPGEPEPEVYMEFRIPAEAWENAVEGMPVLRLRNDS